MHSNSHCKFDLDLTKDYTPPNDLYIEVRAREDIEDVKTKLGGKDGLFIIVMTLEKNNTYLVKKSDVELFIRRGQLVINE
jgi:hypothetical protein